MNKKIYVLITLITMAAFVRGRNIVQAGEYFISPTGKDTAAGTLENPWASPSRGASLRVSDGHLKGSTSIKVRDTSGFLASGNLSIAGKKIPYTEKSPTHFLLASPLEVDLPDHTIIHDADFLGGWFI